MGTQSTLPPPARAADLCKYFTLTDDAKNALQPEMTPEQFLQAAVEKKWSGDAVQFLAHYLPKRQAVFWAMSCVRQSGIELTPEGEAALKATERWIADPSADNRQATLKAADEADTFTPAGMTALAAYYSDGLPQTEEPKNNAKAYFMTAKLAGGAVLTAAAVDRDKVLERFDAFIGKGIEIARKTHKR
jgi:hypothetical protein